MITVHLLTLTETRPGYPPTMRAICGHKSETKKEFSESLAKVTCEECLRLAEYNRPCSLGANVPLFMEQP